MKSKQGEITCQYPLDWIAFLSFRVASVRLRFRNRAGKPMVVQRTFQLQQLKTKVQFKALDGVIRAVNELGEKVSMSQKCGELDRHIPDMLGVSKAILESVIFCHQEESNWPLQEGAVLKKRFDDIFESARYTKALEAIRKLRKARFTDTKEFKRDLDVLSVKMNSAQTIRDKIAIAEDKLQLMLNDASDAAAQVDQAEAKLEEDEQVLAMIQSHRTMLDRIMSEKRQREENVQRLNNNIEKLMSDSDEELKSKIDNYNAIIEEKKSALKGLQQQESQLNSERENAQKDYSKLCSMKGNVEAKIEAKQVLVTELINLASTFGAKYSFHTRILSSQEDDIKPFVSKFKQTVKHNQDMLDDAERTFQKEDDALTSEVTNSTSDLRNIKDKIRSTKRELEELNVEKHQIAAKLKKLGGVSVQSHRDLTYLVNQIAEAEKSLQSYKEKHDTLQMKSEIQDVNREMSSLMFETDEIDSKLRVLRMHERDQIKLDSTRSDYRQKQEEANLQLAEKNSEFHEILHGCATPSDYKSTVEAVRHIDQVVADRVISNAAATREWTTVVQNLQKCTVSSKTVESLISSFRLDHTALERKQISEMKVILDEMGIDMKDAPQALQDLEKAYLEAKAKTLLCMNTITFLNIYKKKGIKDHCCPLCQRGMDATEESAFIEAINEKTDGDNISKKIEKAEAQEKSAREKWKNMETNMSSWKEWIQLEEQIRQKSLELEKIQTKQRQLEEDEREHKRRCDSTQEQLELSQQAKQAMSNLCDFIKNLTDMKARIEMEEVQLNTSVAESLGENTSSLTELQTMKDEKQAQMSQLNMQLKRKQGELQLTQDTLQQMQNDLHNKNQNKLTLEKQKMDYDATMKEQNKLREREKMLKDKLLELTNAEPSLSREVDKKVAHQSAYRAQGNKKKKELRLDLQQIQQDLRAFTDKLQKVEEGNRLQLDMELQKLGHQIAQTKQQQSKATQALDDLMPKIASAKEIMENEETGKRQIKDNLELRSATEQLNAIKAKIEAVQTKMMELPSYDEAMESVRRAKSALGSVRDSWATLRGRKQQLDDQIREDKLQLRGTEFRNVEEKYRTKLIQFETTTMAVADLDRYYKALDQSLLQYHSKKVEEINTIIRSLWQITYKGHDIDTIELMSGSNNDTAATKATRSYDYRVVMKKGGALIDMRGRCSAGQKVLAALVIRLALAETFCLNCGILALDEPTTNLDTENKFGLAQAITE